MIQDDIAQVIAAALKVRLSPDLAKKRYTPGIPAYEAFLKGRYLNRKSTPASLAQAKEPLEQAIALAPDFALAHAELAAYFVHLSIFNIEPARAALPLARVLFGQRAPSRVYGITYPGRLTPQKMQRRPDITVIAPVILDGEIKPAFFTAARGHHADIGGITPGSMPPDSHTI